MSDHEGNSQLDFCPNHIKDGAVPLLSCHSCVNVNFQGKKMQIFNQNYQK